MCSFFLPILASLLPEQASSIAKEVDFVFWLVTVICGISFVLVEGALIYLVVKYRRTKYEEDKLTPFITKHTQLEIIWTVIPTIIVMVVFAYGTITYAKMRTIPENAQIISVVGKQWSWEFTYANGVKINTQSVCSEPKYKSAYDCNRYHHKWTAGDELVVPLGKVRFNMTSSDVIHSMYIPAFRVKQDVVPGITSVLWFEAIKLGTYDLFCTEYCGLDHSGMLAKVKVVSQFEFISWLKTTQNLQDKSRTRVSSVQEKIVLGQQLFKVKKGCVACHRLDGNRLVGPPLNGLLNKKEVLQNGNTVVIDENYLRESLLSPGAKVVKGYPPMNAQDLEPQEIDALVQFLKSCKKVNCAP